MTDEDIAAAKAAEDAAKAEADAKAKADAAAKAESDHKAKEDEDRKRATQSNVPGQLTEEQWVALEKGYAMPRGQILANWSMIQAAQANSPAMKLVEKNAWEEAIKDVPDVSFYSEDAKKAVDTMTPQERMDPKKVREKIMAVRGEKTLASQSSGGRWASGFGGGEPEPSRKTSGEEEPDFSKIQDKQVARDEAEVYRRYGFTSKKEWLAAQKREIPVQDENFIPKFR